jgi:hypothetical protein
MSATIGPSLASNAGFNQQTVLNAQIPPEGPKVVSTLLNFTSTSQLTVDFTIANQQQTITAVQSIWVDNSSNGSTLSIYCIGTQQNVVIPAGWQGTVPIIAANRPKFLVTTTGGVEVNLLWLNVPLTSNLWNPSDASARISGIGPTSFEVVTAGTAVNPFANGVPPGGAVIQNPASNTPNIFVDVVNTAQDVSPGTNGTTVEIVPGADFVIGPGFTGTVTVNCATSATSFVAYGISA